MPFAECLNCGNQFHWSWEDAFNKFGFADGDGQIMTQQVVAVLERAGYAVESNRWGLHNEVIVWIAKDRQTIIPNDTDLGYENPRDYLPEDIIALPDRELPNEEAAL